MTWRVVKIGSLCTPVETTDPRRHPDEAFRYIDISGIDRELKRIATTTEILGADAPSRARQIVRAHDVLVSTVRPNLNAVAMVPPELDGEIASTGFCVLRAIESVLEPSFLFYFTRTEQFIATLLQHVRGANYPAVTDRNVLNVEIPWPGKSEQRRIVEILDQADRLRQLRRAADEKAQRIIPALFYTMFGDPGTNPKGWQSGSLGEFGAGVRYGLGQPPPMKEGGVALIRATNVNGGVIDERGMVYVDPAHVARWRSAFLQAEEIIVVRSGAYTGDVAQVGERWAGSLVGYDLVVTPGKQFTGEFLSTLLLSPFIQNGHFANLRHRAGQPHLNAGQLIATPVVVPPRPLQERFSKMVRSVRRLSSMSSTARQDLGVLFNALLHRAFTGELTAKWREAHKEQLEAELREQLAALERARTERPRRGRGRPPPTGSAAGEPERHAGHDMFNKAALVTYIVQRCHDPRRPHALGRTKLAKLFYLVQRRAEVALTEQFARRAAGPLDDTIHKFLNLAKKRGWLELPPAEGQLKPVVPGRDPQPALDHVRQRWSAVLPAIDQVLDTMKGWGWEALERWATVLHVAENLLAEGKPLTPAAVKAAIAACPEWRAKLDRAAFSDAEIQSTLAGLRRYGFLPCQSAAKN